jgi:hypothetical protein
MKISEIFAMASAARAVRRREPVEHAIETTYRRKTRRRGGVTEVGIPNKIAKRMGPR